MFVRPPTKLQSSLGLQTRQEHLVLLENQEHLLVLLQVQRSSELFRLCSTKNKHKGVCYSEFTDVFLYFFDNGMFFVFELQDFGSRYSVCGLLDESNRAF